MHAESVAAFAMALPMLVDRRYDLLLTWLPSQHAATTYDVNIEALYDDPLVITAGVHSPWARRRKIDLAELIDEPWIIQPPYTWNYVRLSEACEARGLAMPRASLVTLSVHLVAHFLAKGPFITAYPRAVARHLGLKVLAVDLPVRPWPVILTTLKNRTLSPVVERFVECTRETAKSFGGPPPARSA